MKIHSYITGLHHVTATVNDVQEDIDFYTQLLGLRLVKQTVNFDNRQVYHFYYGDETGTPGTIMTTFPYKGQEVRQGIKGTGQVAITSFSIPKGSLVFWKNRLTAHKVDVQETSLMGNHLLEFADPSGLILRLIESERDPRKPWTSVDINGDTAIRGFFNVTLSVSEKEPTLDFLTEVFGFRIIFEEDNMTRMGTDDMQPGQLVDIRHDPDLNTGKNGIGTVHHVAWRIANDDELLEMRKYLTQEKKFKVTEVKDRKYFHSIYFRMPGHVLFEIATEIPGFTVDESKEELGQTLKLPEWEEPQRASIEAQLPKINL